MKQKLFFIGLIAAIAIGLPWGASRGAVGPSGGGSGGSGSGGSGDWTNNGTYLTPTNLPAGGVFLSNSAVGLTLKSASKTNVWIAGVWSDGYIASLSPSFRGLYGTDGAQLLDWASTTTLLAKSNLTAQAALQVGTSAAVASTNQAEVNTLGGLVNVGTNGGLYGSNITAKAALQVGSSVAVNSTNQFEVHAPGGTFFVGTNGKAYGDGSGLTGLTATATNLGTLAFPTNAGSVSFIDLPVASAVAGTLEAYALQIAGSNAISIRASADATTITNPVITMEIPTMWFTNALAAWPKIPVQAGATALVFSNGLPYWLFSTNGAGAGSGTWTATNRAGW